MARISVIINTYNYGRYIGQCVRSILGQTKSAYEVIVVDDGSTDDTPTILETFGSQIKYIRKANGGQASAFNAGFAASSGEWIWFVDADDWAKPEAVEKLTSVLDKRFAKFHFPLIAADAESKPLHRLVPGSALSAGNVIGEVKTKGGYVWPPTTGNVFNRESLARVMPIPETAYRLCADLFICTNVIRYGEVKSIDEPLAYYREHGQNSFHGFRLEPGWLSRQFNNLKRSDELSTALVKDSIDPNFEYRFNRRNIELLILAQRFGGVAEVEKYDETMLVRQWKENPEVTALQGKAALKARVYLLILRWGPAGLIRALQKKNG